jgi:hypothetical protein
VYEYPDKQVEVVQMMEISLEILNLIVMMKLKMSIVVQQVRIVVYENVVLLVQHQVDHHLILKVLAVDWYSRRE